MNQRGLTIEQLKSAIQTIEGATDAPRKRRASKKPQPVRATPSESDSDNSSAAFKKIVDLVNLQERSSNQLRTKLKRASFTDNAIEEALTRATDCGIVDDMRYAQILIRSRISQQCGSAGIEQELKKEGIDINLVPGWPFDYPLSYDEELERAIELLQRKPTRSKNQREGAFRKLVQKGYPISIASQAASQWVSMTNDAQRDY